MSGATIRHLTAANLYIGDSDTSLHLIINNVKLPKLTEKTKDHQPGGSPMGVKLGMQKLEPLDLTFKLEGYTPDQLSHFLQPNRIWYTVRGNIRDMSQQLDIGVKILVEGRMTEVDRGEMGDDSISSDFTITEIFKYQEFWGVEEKYNFDFDQGYNGIRIDGKNPYETVASNLGF